MNQDDEHKPTTTASANTPDIDLVDAGEWPRRDFPIDDGRRENSVRVVIKQSVLNDIHRHGQSTTDVEICGVLVGNGYRDERGPFVYVEANIRGAHSEGKAAQVTFTGETWNHIHNELDREWPDLQILGWYHTHPGFGIFLSGMDLFIHENYFSGEHQLALVYDPVSGDEGLFVWRNGKAVRDGFLVEPDADENPPPPSAAPLSEPMTAGAEMSVSSQEASVDSDLHKRLTRIENRQTLAELGLFTVLVLALAVPLLMWLLWIRPQLPPAGPPLLDPRPNGPALAPPQPDAPPATPQNEKSDDSPAPPETSAEQNKPTGSDGQPNSIDVGADEQSSSSSSEDDTVAPNHSDQQNADESGNGGNRE